MTLHDYKGCLHIHSTRSDGDSTVPELLAAARDVGLDFIILTDHPNPHIRNDLGGGWRDGVLLAVGQEAHAGHHHCIAIGAGHLDGSPDRSVEATLEAIQSQGGLAFVAHPTPSHKPIFNVWTPGWSDWHLDTFDGIEIWPFMHDWIRDLQLWNFLSHCWEPDRWVRGPEPDILAAWDGVGLRRRCVGIGALDNHARRIPFRRGLTLFELLPDRYAFRTVRTHVLSEQPFTGTDTDLATLYALLGAGRCYVSYGLHAEATGFRFDAERGGQTWQMGDELPVGQPVELHAHCPHHATLRLLCDGQPLAITSGYDLYDRAIAPGVYRIEAYLDDRPWVYSNPIYLRPPA